MEGFEKIDLGSPVSSTKPKTAVDTTSVGSQAQIPRKIMSRFGFLRRKPVAILAAVLIVILLSSFALIFPAQKVYKSAKVTSEQAQGMLNALKQQNIALASTNLEQTRQALTQTQKELHSIAILKWIPIAAWYYNDADHLVNAGFAGLDAARVVIDSVSPYADVLGLKGEGSFSAGSAEDRIQTAVSTMDKVTPRIDEVEKYLLLAQEEIDKVNPSHYPPILQLKKVRSDLENIQKTVDNGAIFLSDAKPLIKVLPELLGANGPKRYLVLFQNDKELRATGGFITAYSIFRLDKGVIHVDRSDNIYNLDNTISGKPKAPEIIARYLKVPVLNLRDTNISPDFIESMKTFNSLYENARGGVDVDGIIALDTNVLVSTIKILDDSVSAAGQTFTTKIDPRCDCPQVIYALEANISTPLSLDLRVSDLAAIQAGRKAIIGDLLYAIMDKALKSSPKVYWAPLFQDLVTQIEQKHVMFNIYDAGAQQGLRAVNADGRIKDTDGDYLHINEVNFGGAKSNLFISKDVSQEYEVDGDGTVTKTVTINWKNPHAASDCNLERGNLCLNAAFKDWVRVYVPKGSTLVDSKGSEEKIKTYEDLGKTVYEGFVTIRPKGAATLTITYKIPVKFEKDTLSLLMQKQPGTYAEEYKITVNGSKKEEFSFLSDKELKLSK
ncbi:MAG: DUF4012 domain-containing protein [Candidatus Levyibacteriota bacterium]